MGRPIPQFSMLRKHNDCPVWEFMIENDVSELREVREEVARWCEDTIGDKGVFTWGLSYYIFAMYTEANAFAFKMRWL